MDRQEVNSVKKGPALTDEELAGITGGAGFLDSALTAGQITKLIRERKEEDAVKTYKEKLSELNSISKAQVKLAFFSVFSIQIDDSQFYNRY